MAGNPLLNDNYEFINIMIMPKVSFVVAVYNVSDYIERCAQSLFEQTLDDIEIIFCDDASTDNSLQLIRNQLDKYPQRQDNVKFICNETNYGIALNRWNGAKAATGEFVLFVDGDDYLEVTMGERLYGEAVATGADIVQCDFFKDTPKEIVAIHSSVLGEDPVKCLLNRSAWHNIWIRLFRRSLLDNDQLVWPKSSMAEDLIISMVLTVFAEKVVYLPIPLYHYNYNPDSIMNRKGGTALVDKFEQHLVNTNVLVEFWEKQGLVEKYEMSYVLAKSMTRNILLSLTSKRKYRKLWYHTYPELNKLIFWGDKNHPSSFRNKIWFAAIMLGLYSSCNRLLWSKHLRPSREWCYQAPRKMDKSVFWI